MEKNIESHLDSLDYWRINYKYSKLREAARKFLSAPPSSVESERTFSTVGGIYVPKRTRLTEDHAEQQLFLHHHL